MTLRQASRGKLSTFRGTVTELSEKPRLFSCLPDTKKIKYTFSILYTAAYFFITLTNPQENNEILPQAKFSPQTYPQKRWIASLLNSPRYHCSQRGNR